MYIGNNSRFTKGLMATTVFQKEEKEKKQMRETAKIDTIRHTRNYFNSNLEDQRERNLIKEEKKMMSKGLAQQTYEHVKLKFL